MAPVPRREDIESAPPPPVPPKREAVLPDRRAVVRGGVKLVFVAPIVSTFFASQAYAANYSCYGVGHECLGDGTYEDGNAEECCPGLECTGPPPKTCK